MSRTLVETRNLCKFFKVGSNKQLHAVDGINLKIEEGSTLGIVGESGCGKSTLGRVILKLHEPTGGEILFGGEDITGYSPAQMKQMRRQMQIIFQDPYSSINPRMSVHDCIADPLRVNSGLDRQSEIDKRVKELMDTVGLARRLENAYPHELDGGRRQRVGIARALALNPRFIVCDEPVSALDVSIQAQILNLLMDLQEEIGLTYMFITHDLSVVKHISDEIMVMYLGTCVERAPSGELFRNPLHPYTKALLNAIPVPRLEARSKKIELIKGEITSPVNPEPGCRFASRCPFARAECTGADLPLVEVGGGHWVACAEYARGGA